MLYEIDALLDVDAGGIIVHEGDREALLERLDDWLCTPRSSVYGFPDWGNRLARFKHAPQNETTAVEIEHDIIDTLRKDIPSLKIAGIVCTLVPGVSDRWVITITLGNGAEFSKELPV